MRKHLVIAAVAIASALAVPAQIHAKPTSQITCDRWGCHPASPAATPPARAVHAAERLRGYDYGDRPRKTHQRASLGDSADPRPPEWCAWWLRRHLGIPRSAFPAWKWNLARAFRYVGERASRLEAGVIVVWQHHVGIITGGCDRRGCVVLSGNDGHRVRERYRPIRGYIALRRWEGARASL